MAEEQAEGGLRNVLTESWYQDAEGYLHEVCILRLAVVFLDAAAAAVVVVPVAAVRRAGSEVVVVVLKTWILGLKWRSWMTRLQQKTMYSP